MQKRILVVDDSTINRKILKKTLSSTYDVIEAGDGRAALDILEHEGGRINAVLLDILMPVMDGFEFLSRIHELPRFKDLPIVVMTGEGGSDTEIRALSLGAWDFVPKPYDPTILFFRLKNAIDRSQLSAFQQIKHMAEYDGLTGIYNRVKFYSLAHELVLNNPDETFIFVRFDIDRFKVYNDIFGVRRGDQLLKAIAGAIQTHFTGSKTAYGRIEADHFAGVMPVSEFDPAYYTHLVTERLNAYKGDFRFTPRFGLYIINDVELDMSIISDRALLALRTLKQSYSNSFAYYDDSMRSSIIEEQEIISEMATALRNKEFCIFLQPQYNHARSELIGAEALVRWFHPKKGMIPPYKFIPICEKNGFISKLDEYVWELACKSLRDWIDRGLNPVPISVNISRVDIYNPKLVEVLINMLERYELDPSLLRLEITESAYMESPEQLIEIANRLREHGFFIEMDDFGSGYSSLNSLKEVPVDMIKLDLRFLSSADTDGRGGVILSSIVRMARWLNLPVIAEGVETVKQADYLKSIGCELVQGYLYAKPMPVSEYEELLIRSSTGMQVSSFKIADFFDTKEFWNPQSQSAVIFNSFVGAAGIFEYYDGQLEALRVNDRFYEELGIVRSAFVSHLADFIGFICEDDLPKLISMIENTVATGAEFACETRWNRPRTPDSPIWLRIRSRAIARSDTRHIIYSSIENVTELRKALRELGIQKYGQALYAVYDEIYELDFAAKTVTALASRRRALSGEPVSHPLEQMLGSWCDEHVVSSDRSAVRAFIENASESAQPQSIQTLEYKLLAEDRRIYWCSATLLFIDANRSLLCNIDITERKKADLVLEENAALLAAQKEQDRYRIIFDMAGNMTIIEYDCVNDSFYCSDSYKLYSISRSPLLYATFASFPRGAVHPDDEQTVRGFLHESSRVKNTVNARLGMTSGGYRWSKLMRYTTFDAEGNRKRILGAILDVDDEIRAKAALDAAEKRRHWLDERNRILIESINAMVFDYNPDRDIFVYTAGAPGGGLVETSIHNFLETLPDSSIIHPDSATQFKEVIANACLAPKSGTIEYLGSSRNGAQSHWLRAYYVSVGDDTGRVYRIVGRVEDIQNERDQERLRIELEEELRLIAGSDDVTGLLNEGSAEGMIRTALDSITQGDAAALFILDIDDFREVNETLGALFGNSFLHEVGSRLKKLFLPSDIIGRMGGDEFIVFAPSIHDTGSIKSVAEQILFAISGIPVPTLGSVNCSVGATLVDYENAAYDSAVYEADHALCVAKSHGHGSYMLYGDVPLTLSGAPSTKGSSRTRIDAPHEAANNADTVVKSVFKLLYCSPVIESSVQSVLEIVGSYLDVSRAYIFEDTSDGEYSSNTFEWCNSGVEPQIHNLQMISYDRDMGGRYRDNFDADGVFYCADINELPDSQRKVLEAQGICSMLQCSILGNGKFSGFVGFDECGKKRTWSKEQIYLLSRISRVLGTFLSRRRESERAAKLAESMREIIDSYSSFVFIIDPDTFKISYCNERTRAILGFDPCGAPCHEAVMKLDIRCENCPAMKLIASGASEPIEVYNPTYDIFTQVNSSWITWNGRRMILITCIDITKYAK